MHGVHFAASEERCAGVLLEQIGVSDVVTQHLADCFLSVATSDPHGVLHKPLPGIRVETCIAQMALNHGELLRTSFTRPACRLAF